MPTLEENFLESINQHAVSRELWQQQSTLHEQKRIQLESSINNYLIAARSEYPILRLSVNQLLTGESGSPPTGWYAHPNCTFEKICTVYGKVQAEYQSINRHPESLLLLEAINDPHRDYYIGQPFAIWRMRWTANTPHTLYQYAHMSNVLTGSFAYTKLESGAITGSWAQGISDQWSLTGQLYGGGKPGLYTNCHPHPDSTAGSLLFALPAVVVGKSSVADNIWGLYPFIGAKQFE